MIQSPKKQGNRFSVSRLDNRIITAAWQKHTTLSGREKVKIDSIVYQSCNNKDRMREKGYMSGGGCEKPGERSELIAGNARVERSEMTGEFVLPHGDKLIRTHTRRVER